MSLLDRYVDAVRRYLPRAQRNDIAMELREILQSQVEEQQQGREGPLSDEELSLILKRYGRPRDVAARYGSRQHLIGPAVYPSYVLSMKLVLWVSVPLAVFMVLVALLAADEHLVLRVVTAVGTGLGIIVVNLALVTLIFAFIERMPGSDEENDEEWDPMDLPEAPVPARPIARSEAVGSLLGMTLMLCWWLGLNAVLWRWFGWAQAPFEWSEVWGRVSAVAIALTGAGIVREVLGLVRPRWVKLYLGFGILINILALPVLGRLLRSGTYLIATEPAAGTSATSS